MSAEVSGARSCPPSTPLEEASYEQRDLPIASSPLRGLLSELPFHEDCRLSAGPMAKMAVNK
jgi:hypothetical protein